jgi:hypothetical protein
MRRTALLALAGALVAVTARAQFVPMSRCQAALPCSIPFSISYRPDPLIAGPYSGTGNTGLLMSVPIGFPLAPRLEKSHAPDFGAALEADIRRTMHAKPPSGKSATPPSSEAAPKENPPAPPSANPPPKPESPPSPR